MKIARRFLMYGIPKSFLIKIILFLAILLIGKNVFALEKNVSSSIKYSTDSSGGTYKGDEIYLGGYNGFFNIGTRYNGRLSLIEFYLSNDTFNFTTNHTYTITLNMATEDWRNHFMGPQVLKANSNGSLQSNGSLSVSNFRFVSKKQIKFNFRTNSSLSPYLFFRLYSTDYASSNTVAITGDNNWKLSSIYINDNSSSSGSSGGSTPTPTATPNPDYSDITNNANQNTDSIINNANDNTNDIINNNNANTKEIIDNEQNLLGDCITNLMSGSDIISLDNLYMSGNNFQQITADDNPQLTLSLQAYNNNTYLYNLGDTVTISTTKTYTIRFTKLPDYDRIMFKLNGSTRDTGLLIDVTNLVDDHVYYIGADFFRIIQGDIRFNRLIIKENPNFGFVPWGETYCVSKLDSVSNSISAVSEQLADDVNSLISNQNSNTQQQIDSQRVCNTKIINSDSIINYNTILNNNGSTSSVTSSWGVTDYYSLDNSSVVKITKPFNSSTSYSCFYDENKNYISCFLSYSISTVNIPSNAKFVRFSLSVNNQSPNFSLYSCINGNQALSDDINNLNDSINNSNVDSGTGSDFFNDFSTSDNGGISGIITKPLVLINSLLSNNNSCNNLTFGIKFPNQENKNVSFPSGCILWNNVPSNVVNIYHIFIVGFCSYYLLRRLFKDVEDLKNPEKDNVEVIDL